MPDERETPASPGRQLREIIAGGVAVMPGAFNALSAMAIERAGFEGVYVSGAGLSNAVLGVPDTGLTTLTEAVTHARYIAGAVGCPVIADADTGFGGPESVARTVRDFEQAGLAGIHLEDQQLPKRCGHLPGKELIEPAAMADKIRAAVAARRDPDFLLIARVDARAVTGFDDAVDRAKRYVDAGAGAVFPEALETEDEFARFAKAVPVPLLANMTEFGKSPLLPVETLTQLGYRIIIFPMTLLRAGMKTIDALLTDLRHTGTQAGWLDRMQTRAELYNLIDYQPDS